MQNPYGGRANPGYTTTFDLNGSRVTPAAANGGHGLSAVGSDALLTQRRSIEERPGSFTRPPTLSRRVRRIRPNCCLPRATGRPPIPIGAAPLIATPVLPVGRRLRQESSKDYSAAFR